VRIFYCDQFRFPCSSRHYFPIRKYTLLREAVVAADLVSPDELIVPQPATDEQILRAHDLEYLQRVKRGQLTDRELRRIGLPWSPELVVRARHSIGGTIAACRAALQDGISVSLAGGTHHAFRDHGQGFCLFNDSIIAARAMQAAGRARKAAILDCDAHQGNGTAAIAADDPTIFTFSIHNEQNFPLHKELSDLDVGLKEGTRDETYLEALERGAREALEAAGADLVIYLAGADPYEDDLLGRLSVSKAGLAERDRLVLELCRQASVPAAITIAGGYARRMKDTVDIHLQTVRIAASKAARWASA